MKTMRYLLLCSLLLAVGFGVLFSECKQEHPVALNIQMPAAATILNPLLRSTGYSGFVAAQIFQTFGTLDPESLVMQPSLAIHVPTPVEVTSGPHKGEQAYSFEINAAAKWDNGSPVTGEDFLFTLKLIIDSGLDTRSYRGYYEFLTGMDINPANPKKFTVYMRQYYIMAQEALCSTPVYPSYNYDPKGLLKNVSLTDLLDPVKGKAFADSPAGKTFAEEFSAPKYSTDPQLISGSGPYSLKSMNGDQGVVLVKKSNWWGDDQAKAYPMLAVYPEQLVYKIVKDEAAIQSLLQTGDIDIATDVSTGLFLTMQQDTHLTRMYDFKTGWAPRYGRMILNLRQSDSNLLADIRVRKALAYVVDYDYLINTIQQGFAQPIIGPIHPAKAYYAKNIQGYTYNPAEAKRLLTEAGWKDSDKDGVLDKLVNGKRTRLSLRLMNPSGSAIAEAVGNSIVEKARQSQIEIILDPQDISNVTKKTMAGQFEMANIGASTQTGLDELNQYYHSESPDNRGRYRNIRLDSIIEAIQVTQDVPTRNSLYVEAQQIIHDDVPMVFLYCSIRRYIVSKKYNYVLTAVGPGFYEQMFQRKEEPLK